MTLKNLPPNWSWVKLGDVCYTTSGGTPSRGNIEYYNGTIPWVKSGELDKGLILDTEEKISEEALKNSSAKLFPKGTLLIALYGATIGKLAFLGVEAATNQAVCGIYKNENIDSNFLFNFLFFKKQYLVKQSIGGAQPNISQGILKNLDIPLPPLPEQKKIVEKIEELFSGLDDGVTSLKKAKEQIRLYRQSVLASAFSGKLVKDEKRETKNKLEAYLNGVQGVAKAAEPHQDYRDSGIDGIKTQKKSNGLINPENPQILLHHGSDNLPDGWKWVKLGEVCDKIQDGSHFSPQIQHSQKSDGKFLYITSKNIRNNYLDLNNVTYVDKEFHNSIFQRCNPEFGDVLLTKDGANTGNVTINTLKEEFSLLSSVCLIKPNKQKINSHFIKYYLQSPSGFKAVTGAMTGTAIKRIILKTIKDADIILPPIIQQTQIVEEIEKRFSEADNLEKAIDESLAKSERLRQSILKKAFEGRLV